MQRTRARDDKEEYAMSHPRVGLRILAFLSLVAFVGVGPRVSAAAGGQPQAHPKPQNCRAST